MGINMSTQAIMNKIINYIELITKKKIILLVEDEAYVANQPNVHQIQDDILKEIRGY